MIKTNASTLEVRRTASFTNLRRHALVSDRDPSNSPNVKEILEPEVDVKSLPPVSTSVAILIIIVYNLADRWGITATHISVSWTTVVTEKGLWRLFLAHFFHFRRVAFLINVMSLMALGRYLERKIRPIPMFLLIQLMGILGNVFYVTLSRFIYEAPDDSTFGFSHTVFALKMIQVLSKDAGQRRGPTLLLGVFPVFLGPKLAPWEPFLEGIVSDVLLKGKNIATHVSGVGAGLVFPLIDFYFHEKILVSPKLNFTFTEPSSGAEAKIQGLQRSCSELERLMKVLKEEHSDLTLFHALPSNECITLFHCRKPLPTLSLGLVSKSDSHLFAKSKLD